MRAREYLLLPSLERRVPRQTVESAVNFDFLRLVLGAGRRCMRVLTEVEKIRRSSTRGASWDKSNIRIYCLSHLVAL